MFWASIAHLQEYRLYTPYAIVYNVYNLCSWRWAYRSPKHVELFMIMNKLLHQVGTSRHFKFIESKCTVKQ